MTTGVRWEQFRQARSIHGGTLQVAAAALGVRLSRVPIPGRRLRESVFRALYGQKYKPLNEAELDRPLSEFRSINELFTRPVPPTLRPIESDTDGWLSPCDATVQEVGDLSEDTTLVAKGTRYSLESLLPGCELSAYVGGSYSVLFLSPADCHRVFAPHAGVIEEIVHVPGCRLLVHPPFQNERFPVFTLNERVILRMRTELGGCTVVLVAGWGVGNITHPFHVDLRVSKSRVTRCSMDPGRKVSAGDWIATFELGSTVILITDGQHPVSFHIQPEQAVQYGKRISSVGRTM